MISLKIHSPPQIYKKNRMKIWMNALRSVKYISQIIWIEKKQVKRFLRKWFVELAN